MLEQLEIWPAENHADPAILDLMKNRIVPFMNHPEARRKWILQMKPTKWIQTTYLVGDLSSTGYFELFQFEDDFVLREPETAVLIAGQRCMGGIGCAKQKEEITECSSEDYVKNKSEEKSKRMPMNCWISFFRGRIQSKKGTCTNLTVKFVHVPERILLNLKVKCAR